MVTLLNGLNQQQLVAKKLARGKAIEQNGSWRGADLHDEQVLVDPIETAT